MDSNSSSGSFRDDLERYWKEKFFPVGSALVGFPGHILCMEKNNNPKLNYI